MSSTVKRGQSREVEVRDATTAPDRASMLAIRAGVQVVMLLVRTVSQTAPHVLSEVYINPNPNPNLNPVTVTITLTLTLTLTPTPTLALTQ